MGLVVGLGELALFTFFAAVCVALVLTLIFGVLSLVIGALGISLDSGDDDVAAITVFTMIVWALMLVVGSICSATGHTSLWNVSPFGLLQGVLWRALRPYFLPTPHTWQTDQSSMWATFWSYCLTSLLASILMVVAYTLYERMKAASRGDG